MVCLQVLNIDVSVVREPVNEHGFHLLTTDRLTEAERRNWPVMSRDHDGNVDFSAWNAVNASSSDVLASGAHRLEKMLIRCAFSSSYLTVPVVAVYATTSADAV